jgi:hypothetical protein
MTANLTDRALRCGAKPNGSQRKSDRSARGLSARCSTSGDVVLLACIAANGKESENNWNLSGGRWLMRSKAPRAASAGRSCRAHWQAVAGRHVTVAQLLDRYLAAIRKPTAITTGAPLD